MSWNNGDIISPNMQDMVDSGIKLNQFYTQPTCSPSRAALLTGQYPIHTGFNVRFFPKNDIPTLKSLIQEQTGISKQADIF